MKKIITKKEYAIVVGLMALARRAYKQIQECEKAYGETIEMEEEYGSYGHFSDEIFNEGNVDKVLKNEGIKIKSNPIKTI